MQPPEAKRKVIDNARQRRAELRHASPAVQLFRALRAGHRGSRASISRTTTSSSPASTKGDAAAGRLLQAAGLAERASGLRRRAVGRRAHRGRCVAQIKASPLWSSTRDHRHLRRERRLLGPRPPPKGDRWGPGTRIPAIIISPFAKRGYVDHTPYDTTSILKLITRRFELEPLPGVRAGAGDLTPRSILRGDSLTRVLAGRR